MCVSRRGRAELEKNAVICSLKIKFEAHGHKSSSIYTEGMLQGFLHS